MLFNFAMVPLEEVQPWGKPGRLSLSWFGLTDSQYWVQAGTSVLLEYSGVARRLGSSRYCDYQVVRLYEDVMALLPYVLEPVPADLIQYISGDRSCVQERATAWHAANSERDDDLYWEIIDGSSTWIGNRSLHFSYLSPSANILMWSDESLVHIEWDNRAKLVDGVCAWSAECGSHSLPRSEFKEEVRSFHKRLMDEMSVRVSRVVAGGLPADVHVDVPGLLREHEQRKLLPASAFELPSPHTDWQAVRKALLAVDCQGSADRWR